MPRRHVLASTYEFLDIIRTAETSSGIMASLDVESLFTNVPMEEAIKIVPDNVYDHSEMAPPKIPPNFLQEMLLTCTTETQFVSPTGQIYLQRDGCAMGSCLTPTLADFFMPGLKPTIYCRYVDDIFVLAKNIDQVLELRHSFMNNSVLNFTYELEKYKKLNFLDVTVTRGSNGLLTSVYIKPTYDNQTQNYASITPLKYKVSTVKTLLHRCLGFLECFPC